MLIKPYIKALTNLLFPLTCLSCATKIEQGYLCSSCYNKIELLNPPLCLYCSTPLIAKKICWPCQNGKFPYDQLISIAEYKPPLNKLIQLFKYKHYDYLAKYLAQIMIDQLLSLGCDLSNYNLIIPVPLSRQKLKEREFNQTYLLAETLANYFNILIKDDIIYANKDTASQVNLTKKERKRNIENKFFINDVDLKGQRVILLDDIFTTGATIKACAKLLKQAKAETILVLTLAKTML